MGSLTSWIPTSIRIGKWKHGGEGSLNYERGLMMSGGFQGVGRKDEGGGSGVT